MKDSIKAKAGQPETHNNYLSHIRAVYNKALKDNMTYREFKFDTDSSTVLSAGTSSLEQEYTKSNAAIGRARQNFCVFITTTYKI